MAVEWKVNKNPNAYREISKHEYSNSLKYGEFTRLPTYYNDGKYYMMNRDCHTLIWLCAICINIPEITEDNYKEVYRRIKIHEKLFGATTYAYNPKTDTKSERLFDINTIKSHIGIKTNGTWLDSKEWSQSVIDKIADDIRSTK